AISPALRGFEERRATGRGRYLTDSLLRKNEQRQLGDLLASQLAGLKIMKMGSGDVAVSKRGKPRGKEAMLNRGSQRACFATVYVNGVMIYDKSTSDPKQPPPDLREFPVSQIAAIEFYPGQSTLPVQFKASECGTLLLWLREK